MNIKTELTQILGHNNLKTSSSGSVLPSHNP